MILLYIYYTMYEVYCPPPLCKRTTQDVQFSHLEDNAGEMTLSNAREAFAHGRIYDHFLHIGRGTLIVEVSENIKGSFLRQVAYHCLRIKQSRTFIDS